MARVRDGDLRGVDRFRANTAVQREAAMIERQHPYFDRLTPIVIGGCARSGTTLLSTLLSGHSKIHLISDNEQDRESNALCCDLGKDDSSLAEIRGELFTLPANITCWCEKSPGNIHHAASTLGYFGGRVRFLNMVRDGRDVVVSRHPSRPEDYWVPPQRWVADVLAGMRVEQDDRVMTLRYEDVVREPERMLRRACEFIDQPFETGMLNYPATAAVHRSGAWFGGEAVPVHDRSIGRWRTAEHAERVAAFLEEPEAVALLRHYEYLD